MLQKLGEGSFSQVFKGKLTISSASYNRQHWIRFEEGEAFFVGPQGERKRPERDQDTGLHPEPVHHQLQGRIPRRNFQHTLHSHGNSHWRRPTQQDQQGKKINSTNTRNWNLEGFQRHDSRYYSHFSKLKITISFIMFSKHFYISF